MGLVQYLRQERGKICGGLRLEDSGEGEMGVLVALKGCSVVLFAWATPLDATLKSYSLRMEGFGGEFSSEVLCLWSGWRYGNNQVYGRAEVSIADLKGTAW